MVPCLDSEMARPRSISLATGLRKADEEEELASLAHEGWIQRSTGLTAMEHSLAATPFELYLHRCPRLPVGQQSINKHYHRNCGIIILPSCHLSRSAASATVEALAICLHPYPHLVIIAAASSAARKRKCCSPAVVGMAAA